MSIITGLHVPFLVQKTSSPVKGVGPGNTALSQVELIVAASLRDVMALTRFRFKRPTIVFGNREAFWARINGLFPTPPRPGAGAVAAIVLGLWRIENRS